MNTGRQRVSPGCRMGTRAVLVFSCACVLAASLDAGQRGHIQLYTGYGTTRAVIVRGRALANEQYTIPRDKGSRIGNLIRAVRMLDARELRGKDVTVHCAGQVATCRTDEEGMFSVRLEAGGAEFPVGQLPVAVEANMSADITLAAEGVALIYPEDARRVVVCDVDDTIAETGMGSKLRAGMQAIFGDAVRTKPVRGMSELLHALAAGGEGEQPSPIFYVSGGPINFYPRVSAFLSMHGFPEGALMLRNFGRGPGNDPWSVEQYKMDRIEGLLGLFERSRFLLVGDSTEKDPEAYAALRKRHTERIEAILIRRVDGKAGADAQDDRFKNMILFDDGADALRSAIGAGLVRQPEPASAAPEGASHEEHHLQAGGPE